MNYSFDDFTVKILTVNNEVGKQRQLRMADQLLAAAITDYSFSIGDLFLDSPLPQKYHHEVFNEAGVRAGEYGLMRNVCNALSGDFKYCVIFEDDAVINEDFKSVFIQHIEALPDDWTCFFAGYGMLRESTDINNLIVELPSYQCYGFSGSFCFVYKKGIAEQLRRSVYTFDVLKLFGHSKPRYAYDCVVPAWLTATNNKIYLAKKSFVGHHDGWSLILNRDRKVRQQYKPKQKIYGFEYYESEQ